MIFFYYFKYFKIQETETAQKVVFEFIFSRFH